MLYKDILRALSTYLWILCLPLLIPLSMAFYFEHIREQDFFWRPCFFPFLSTIFIAIFLGAFFRLVGKNSSGHLYRKEALLLVILVYLLTPAIGALPFYISQTLKNPADAYFEAASGFTTTGATVMTAKKYDAHGKELPLSRTFITGDITTYSCYGTLERIFDAVTGTYLVGLDAVNPALIFWRSFMQWLGGGGIIVLFVAILPALGVGGKVLFQTEITGQTKESILPRIKETASLLWKIYLILTVLQVSLLMLTNDAMSFFDALTISFSTISTGGFAPKNDGIAAYNNAYTDWIIIIFMILGSISFSIYFFCWKGKFSKLKDPELRVFLLIILCSCIFTIWQLTPYITNFFSQCIHSPTTNYSLSQAIRYGVFQVVSIQTSTGFTTANFDVWPFTVQVLLLILMFVGGMAGSTAGGLKVIRQQTFFRIMLNKIESIYRPDTVRSYRIGLTPIDNNTAVMTLCFFMVAASIVIIGTFLLVLLDIDPESSLTAISCMVNNTGVAFRMGGPDGSFAFLPTAGKIICSLWMIAGRLEYFTVLIAFVPAFWRST